MRDTMIDQIVYNWDEALALADESFISWWSALPRKVQELAPREIMQNVYRIGAKRERMPLHVHPRTKEVMTEIGMVEMPLDQPSIPRWKWEKWASDDQRWHAKKETPDGTAHMDIHRFVDHTECQLVAWDQNWDYNIGGGGGFEAIAKKAEEWADKILAQRPADSDTKKLERYVRQIGDLLQSPTMSFTALDADIPVTGVNQHVRAMYEALVAKPAEETPLRDGEQNFLRELDNLFDHMRTRIEGLSKWRANLEREEERLRDWERTNIEVSEGLDQARREATASTLNVNGVSMTHAEFFQVLDRIRKEQDHE